MINNLPFSLKKGDTVGFFSSSSPTNQIAINKMINYFESRGYKTIVAPHTLVDLGFMAGTPKMKTDDLHYLVKNDNVKIIITASGGTSSLQMLPYIDYKLIAKHPKIICGLSDPTTILNSISHLSGVPTFHGPNGVSFGESDPTQFSESNWWNIVTNNLQLPFEYPVQDKIKVLKKCEKGVEGEIFGGNLGMLCFMMGSKYFPNMKGKILFIEEIFKNYYQIDNMLNQLKNAGVFNQIVGLIVGENYECKEANFPQHKESYEEVLLRNLGEFDFPIIYNVPLGHTEDKITIPIGIKVRMETNPGSIKLVSTPFQSK